MPTSTHYPVADFFFDNDWAMIARGRGRLVSLTQPYIQIAELEQMPIGIFRQAVQWALGRAPRDGDRLAFTAGEKFQKGDKIKNCLILCPTMPKSRASSLFPKVWMERREGEWVILMSEISGAGAEEMARALVTHPPWNLTTDRPV